MHDSWCDRASHIYRTRLTPTFCRSSFLNSRPSHLQTGNTSVPIPDPSCTESLDGNTISSNSAIAFHYLCRLAVQVGFFRTFAAFEHPVLSSHVPRAENDLCTIEKLRLAKAGQPTVLRSVEKEIGRAHV